MKFSWLNTLSLAIAAAAVAFAVARSEPAPTSIDRLQDVSWLTHQLKLTSEQVQQITKLQSDFGDTLNECCGRHCTARLELGEQFFKSEFGAEKQRKLVEEMCHAQADSDSATLQHIRQVYSVLDDGQKAQYEELVTKCLCAECPTCSSH